MIRYLTCGESHGKMLAAIVENIPKGLKISPDYINKELIRRQKGYGRGARCISIEKDTVDIISGVRWGETTGAPIGLIVPNKDWENRKKEISVYKKDYDSKYIKTKPRPGHADLAGILKYDSNDITPILERASARSTASQVAVGALCKRYLEEFGIKIIGYTESIGDIWLKNYTIKNLQTAYKDIEQSEVRCPGSVISKKMISYIDKIKKQGNTLGGTLCVEIHNVSAGLGSHTHWDRRLDASLANVLMSIPSVKGVEIGRGFKSALSKGSNAHDEIFYSKTKGYYHKTNNCGGIEGGISNGEIIKVRTALKPIPTLLKPLKSVDIRAKKQTKAETVRSDVCVVPSAIVVAEAMCAYAIACAHREKFAGDNIKDIKKSYRDYCKRIDKKD